MFFAAAKGFGLKGWLKCCSDWSGAQGSSIQASHAEGNFETCKPSCGPHHACWFEAKLHKQVQPTFRCSVMLGSLRTRDAAIKCQAVPAYLFALQIRPFVVQLAAFDFRLFHRWAIQSCADLIMIKAARLYFHRLTI